MEWISIKEKLPENQTLVIVTDGKEVSVSDFWNGWIYLHMPYIEKVTHWMPLPSPPKEAE